MDSTLTKQEELRYFRQISLTGFDYDKQEQLKQSRVLIIGLGGLGCAASQYLASSGVGHLTLIDDDRVDESNLHRQLLHHDADLGQRKTHSAKAKLSQINPYLSIDTVERRLNDEQLCEQIKQHDIVLDASDNLQTRNQLNRCCYSLRTPLISGAAIRMEGQISVFEYRDAKQPCYQCFSQWFSPSQLSCVEAGVMPAVVGIIGATQALEAIKVLCHFGKPLQGKLLLLDAMTLQWQTLGLPKSPDCPVCATGENTAKDTP